MTLPGSGTLSLSSIQGEFGGSNPISMSEYYRSGPYVPNYPANSPIPTSGTISINQFYGATNSAPANQEFGFSAGTYVTGGKASQTYTGAKVWTSTVSTYTFGSFFDNSINMGGSNWTVQECYQATGGILSSSQWNVSGDASTVMTAHNLSGNGINANFPAGTYNSSTGKTTSSILASIGISNGTNYTLTRT